MLDKQHLHLSSNTKHLMRNRYEKKGLLCKQCSNTRQMCDVHHDWLTSRPVSLLLFTNREAQTLAQIQQLLISSEEIFNYSVRDKIMNEINQKNNKKKMDYKEASPAE